MSSPSNIEVVYVVKTVSIKTRFDASKEQHALELGRLGLGFVRILEPMRSASHVAFEELQSKLLRLAIQASPSHNGWFFMVFHGFSYVFFLISACIHPKVPDNKRIFQPCGGLPNCSKHWTIFCWGLCMSPCFQLASCSGSVPGCSFCSNCPTTFPQTLTPMHYTPLLKSARFH